MDREIQKKIEAARQRSDEKKQALSPPLHPKRNPDSPKWAEPMQEVGDLSLDIEAVRLSEIERATRLAWGRSLIRVAR